MHTLIESNLVNEIFIYLKRWYFLINSHLSDNLTGVMQNLVITLVTLFLPFVLVLLDKYNRKKDVSILKIDEYLSKFHVFSLNKSVILLFILFLPIFLWDFKEIRLILFLFFFVAIAVLIFYFKRVFEWSTGQVNIHEERLGLLSSKKLVKKQYYDFWSEVIKAEFHEHCNKFDYEPVAQSEIIKLYLSEFLKEQNVKYLLTKYKDLFDKIEIELTLLVDDTFFSETIEKIIRNAYILYQEYLWRKQTKSYIYLPKDLMLYAKKILEPLRRYFEKSCIQIDMEYFDLILSKYPEEDFRSTTKALLFKKYN